MDTQVAVGCLLIIGFILWVIHICLINEDENDRNRKEPINPVPTIPSSPVQVKLVEIVHSIIVPVKSYASLYPKLPEWFVCENAPEPSPAEQLIINELRKYVILWEREVSFESLTSPKGGHLRYDFWFPDYNLLIEYDGKQWHSAPERIVCDHLKSEFCSDYGLELIRFDAQHYYQMEYVIADLMERMRIEKVPF